MRLGLLGERTNSRLAAERLDENYNLVSFPCMEDVFKALEEGNVNQIIVPVKNSRTGEIREYAELVRARKLHLIKEVVIPIKHCLARGRRHWKIGFIMSHDEALKQCASYLNGMYPEIYRESMESTEAAARFVAQIGIGGAIVNRETCEHYHLDLVDENIVKDNYSTFGLFEKG